MENPDKKIYTCLSKKYWEKNEFVYEKNKEADAKYFIGLKLVKKLDHYSSHFHKGVDTPIKLKNSVHVLFNPKWKLSEKYESIWNKISNTIMI